jgi:hypothetical protein
MKISEFTGWADRNGWICVVDEVYKLNKILRVHLWATPSGNIVELHINKAGDILEPRTTRYSITKLYQ